MPGRYRPAPLYPLYEHGFIGRCYIFGAEYGAVRITGSVIHLVDPLLPVRLTEDRAKLLAGDRQRIQWLATGRAYPGRRDGPGDRLHRVALPDAQAQP